MNKLPLRNLTLEISLKPFFSVTDEAIEKTCRQAFDDWRQLIKWADQVSIMFWTGDGTEILIYDGDLDREMEWARYIGSVNPKWEVPGDPEKKSIHARPYLYTEKPAVITYRDMKRIIAAMKRIGTEMTGKPVRVGETFDPGTEFAKSDFKYKWHNEICLANTGGPKSFACCYAVLDGDDRRYAGFPNGIPQGTTLGTFLGRQCQHMLTDLGFDYIWLSNGFGFGLETWMTRGPMFDGTKFDASQANEIREKILNFWRTFRAECPDIPIETRGTNLTTGIDLASDAVPLAEIYDGNFKMVPPPNSPWAALNSDFGLEMTGFMSHIAKLPGDHDYPYRFYTHDAWWHNSPWLDRYAREPHDIYMPLSVSRIDSKGNIEVPSRLSLLSIDDSLGRMPEQVPNEVIPHIQEALRRAPDAAGPVVWVYPFDEYHRMTFDDKPARIDELLFADWFVRSAINSGLPVNTVVSSTNFLATLKDKSIYAQSVLLTPVPDAGTKLSDAICDHVEQGGKVLLYGPVRNASDRLLKLLGLRKADPIDGTFTVDLAFCPDELSKNAYPTHMLHRPIMNAGGYDAITVAKDATVLASVVSESKETRAASVYRADPSWKSGALAWVRGTNASQYVLDGDLISGKAHLPISDDPATHFHADHLMRFALDRLGWSFTFNRRNASQKTPITFIARNRGAFYYSGFSQDTTVEVALRAPQGMPIFLGQEAEIIGGKARYHMPRAWRRECRFFIDQPDGGIVTWHENTAEMIGLKRRCRITGLENATVRFYAEPDRKPVSFVINGSYPYFQGPFADFKEVDDAFGKHWVCSGLTGTLLVGY
jgi:hypothetical protein